MLGKLNQIIRLYSEPFLAYSKQLFLLFTYLNDRIFASSRNLHVFLIQGPVKDTNSPMKTLFIGTEESAYEFADQAYSKIEKIASLMQLKQNQINSLRLPPTEIAAARIDRPFIGKFQKQNYLVLPNVSFSLDLRTSISSLTRRMSRRRRRDIERIKKLDYSYSIDRKDEGDFDFFYREMYVPYALKRFEKAAHIKTYLESKAVYKGNGGILFLKKKDKPIASILFQIRGKELRASSFGVYKGDESYLHDLASQATLFFLIEWARTQGIENLDYGTCIPFLKGGIFTYKKEWGMTVEEQRSQSVCILKLNSATKGSLSFFQQNPFIIVDKKKLKGVIFLDHKPDNEELRQIFSRYFLPKIDSFIIIAYFESGTEIKAKRELSLEYPNLTKPLLDICEALQDSNFRVEISELLC